MIHNTSSNSAATGEKVYVSPWDHRCKLHIEDHGAYIEFHESTPDSALESMKDWAWRRGWTEDNYLDGADPYDYMEEIGRRRWRLWLVPVSIVCHPENDPRYGDLPSLTETAFGPLSGEIKIPGPRTGEMRAVTV